VIDDAAPLDEEIECSCHGWPIHCLRFNTAVSKKRAVLLQQITR
jgi:hypothetical protein